MRSLCCLNGSHWLPFIASLTFCLPRVMPFGHIMLSVTKAKRSAPFSPLLSILAFSPQSVQYIKLKRTQTELLKMENMSLKMINKKRKPIPNLKNKFQHFLQVCPTSATLSETFTYLFMGSTTMALGFSRFSVIRVFLLLPSVVATAIVFKTLSVQ